MRKLLILLLFPLCAWGAEGDRPIYGTFGGNAVSSTVRCSVCSVYFDSTAGNGFGSGTATLQMKSLDGTWRAVKDYTASPDPNPEIFDFGYPVVDKEVRINFTGSSSPTLYFEIDNGG